MTQENPPSRAVAPIPAKRPWSLRKKIAVGVGSAMLGMLLLALIFPATSNCFPSSTRARDQSNLKQVGLLCHLYAGDHQGQFPVRYTEIEGNITQYEGLPPTKNSNEAFRALFATGYTREERVFYSRPEEKSFADKVVDFFNPPYEPFCKPDNQLSLTGNDFKKALERGECSYIYFAGQSKSSPPGFPLACNFVRGTITYELGKGFIARDLSPEIHKGEGIVVVKVDGFVEFMPRAKDGTVLLCGPADAHASRIKVVYPWLLAPKP